MNLKTCAGCGVAKDKTEFTSKRAAKDGLNASCRVCTRARSAAHFARHPAYYSKKAFERNTELRRACRAFMNQQKSAPCSDCGVSYPPYVMDFDHVRWPKTDDVAAMVGQVSLQTLKDEIAKCEVVCANCHRERTHKKRTGQLLGPEAQLEERETTNLEVVSSILTRSTLIDDL